MPDDTWMAARGVLAGKLDPERTPEDRIRLARDGMEETRVVHVDDKVPGAVYIGRAMPRRGLKASKWANPYKIGAVLTPHDIPLGFAYPVGVMDRHDVLVMYACMLQSSTLLADLPDLRGHALACWCRHDGEPKTNDTMCHGDILVAYLDLHTDDDLRALVKGDDDA
jgi:hypothetical protein